MKKSIYTLIMVILMIPFVFLISNLWVVACLLQKIGKAMKKVADQILTSEFGLKYLSFTI